MKPGDIIDGKCRITGDDFRHLVRVRRVRSGDIISLQGADCSSFEARVTMIGKSHLEAELLRIEDRKPIPVRITLCLSLLKGKHFDLAVQKAAEVGVYRIIPVITERTVPIPHKGAPEKLKRWRRIALEAAKQSMRSDVPHLDEVLSFKEVTACDLQGMKILAHPAAEMAARDLLRRHMGEDAALMIGPEGGFSDGEIDMAEREGWDAVNFGPTHLRAETAAIVLPAIVIYQWSVEDEDQSER